MFHYPHALILECHQILKDNMTNGIDGIVESILYEASDTAYKVISVKSGNQKYVCIGEMPTVELYGNYHFNGEMSINEKYGLRFNVSSYCSILHDTKDGLIAYLSSNRFQGIGPKTATKIVDSLGLDAIAKIKEDINFLTDIGVKPDKAIQIQQKLKQCEDLEETFVKLYNYGISFKMANKIYSIYKNNTLSIIEKNPYILLNDIEGYGFLKCDSLAMSMGFSTHNQKRLEEGLLYTLFEACNQYGYTYLHLNQLIPTALNLLNKNKKDLVIESELLDCLESLVKLGRLVLQGKRYYPKNLFESEEKSRESLNRINTYSLKLPTKDKVEGLLPNVEEKLGFSLTSLQKEALIRSATSKISIITGGPGTGKTTIVKGLLILEAFINKLDLDSDTFRQKVLLVSPTGKAAKRLQISCGMEAMTIHKALGYNEAGNFSKSNENKLNKDLIIIDESSMIDISLLYHLLDAVNDYTKLIFVGDKDQLPSVGPGNVLYELINSKKFTVTELKEIMRQKADSNIIKLSQMVLNKNINFQIFNSHKEVFFYQADGQVVLNNIESLLNLFIKKGGDIKKDIQILVPMYSGTCGIDAINKMIQAKFNPSDKILVRGERIFKENDKVLMLQNNPTLGVMNGDDGIITSIEAKDDKEYLYINFNGTMVKLSAKDIDQITLGYAISVHKSQGSEFKNVIIPIVPAFNIMLKPNLIYTAFTRAKEKLIILGNKDTLISGVMQKNDIRQTSLYSFVNEFVKKEEKIIYINDPEIPFDTLGEKNMENVSPYDFM